MDPTPLITRQPFNVEIRMNGIDVTPQSPVVEVKYNADGTGTRTLRDGRRVAGTWRFTDDTYRHIEVLGPEGKSRWVIVQLDDTVYRKVNVDTGVEFVHRPRRP